MTRIEADKITRMLEDSKDTAAPAAAAAPNEPAETDDTMISIDDFLKVDLRVARVLQAELVDGADKLLRITVDDGNGERTVLAGIRSAYDPETLIGRHVVVVANLQPRKMRFGTSEGMILAAGDNEIFLLSPDDGASAGMRVR